MISRAAARHSSRRAIMATVARIAPASSTASSWLGHSGARFQSTAVAAEPTAPPPSTSSSSSTSKAKTPLPFVSTPERKYEYFCNVEVTDKGVALIQFDCPGKSVNTISFAFADEAKKLWQQEIRGNAQVKAVVFTSAKPNMFIAGADIFDIKRIENKQDLVPLIADGVEFFQSWKKDGLPLVAAIDGPALGGGLEWALWCDYRVCSDSSKTKLGLPEVKLGLLPGFGGTQNLPATVGLQNAMDMMLTGKEIRPDKAKKMGLVDLVVAPASLKQAALDAAEQLASGKLKPKKKAKSFVNRVLEDTSMGRSMIWSQIDKMVKKNTDGHYPAPFSIIQCVQYGLENPSARFKNEREQFAKLAATPESQALIGIFEGTTALKKQDEQFKVPNLRKVDTVAVLGAGLMGAGIAQVTAEKCGYSQILLKDRNDEAVARGQAYLYDNWTKKVQKKRMSDYQRNKNFSSVVPLTDTTPSWKQHFSKTDIIIEAVFEDLTLKQKIVADMEAVTPDHCVFATNTSAIPIRDIAANAKRPENIIGMHYFSPVPNMPLLEIIPHEGTSDETKATAFNVGTKQGKTCIVVKDVPGFYVNRCLGPYLVEVSALVRDGVSLEQLDKSVKNFGMPVGPVTLADEVGVDVTSHVAKFLSNADLGVRMTGGDVTLMEQMVAKGWLGKKSGQGFYTYGKGKNAKKTISAEVQAFVKQFATQKLTLDEKEIQDRIVSR